MKKLIIRLIAFCALIALSLDTAYASQNRRGRYRTSTTTASDQSGQRSQRRKTTSRRVQRRRTPDRKKKQLQPNISKQEAKQAIDNTKKTVADTKKLEEKVKAVQTAPTPQAQQKAKEDLRQLYNTVAKDITQRSLWSDIYSGYNKEQIDKAKKVTEKLGPIRLKVAKELSTAKVALDQVTSKGYLWNAALPGKEKEYGDRLAKVTQLQNLLARIDQNLSDQKVITGEAWSNAYWALLTAGTIGTLALGTDVALYSGAGTLAAAGKASALAQTAGSGIVSAGSWVKENTPSPTAALMVGMTGLRTISELGTALAMAKGAYEISKAAYRYGVENFIKENPKASRKQVEAALPKEKAAYEKAKADFEKAGNEYQTALAKEQPRKK